MADGSWPLHPARRPIHAGAPGKLKVVGFAGGGGSSEAVREALGADPDLAMNHWMVAVLAHQRHFPRTEHRCADIWQEDPRAWRPGEPIGFAWFSPDCTDFSKAKGKAPRSERIRGLAWSIIPWAVFRTIDTIMIENVEEFVKWGPVYRSGLKAGEPIPKRRGETFQRFVRRLKQVGYWVEHRFLNAADYGAPTTRKRFYAIAKHVGVIRVGRIEAGLEASPIVWPEPSHAPRHLAEKLGRKPWVGACEIIDWNERCPSIFLTPEEAKAEGLKVKRPLVGATHSRIARGLERFVIGSAEPFVVPLTHQGDLRTHAARDPLRTVTGAQRGELAAVDVGMISNAYGSNTRGGRGDPRDPAKTLTGAHHSGLVVGSLVRTDMHQSNARCAYDAADPLRTVTSAGGHAAMSATIVGVGGRRGSSPPTSAARPFPTVTGKADAALATGYLVPRYGERDGQAPRALPVTGPYPAVVPDQNGGSLAAVSLHRQFGRSIGGPANDPAPTPMPGGGGKTAVQIAWLGRQFGSNVSGRPIGDPAPTVMSGGGGGKTQLVVGSLASYYATGEGSGLADPMRSATGRARHGLTLAHVLQANTGLIGRAATDPLSTIVQLGSTQQLIETALALEGGPVGRRAQVLEFLWRHFGPPTPDEWRDPAATLQGRLKFGLVVIDELIWMIVDIGLRMLKPSELAAAMGLRPGFDLSVNALGEPVSKTHQIQMIGNMVSPPPAIAMIRANCPDLIEPQDWKEAA
jgi:DNA (cytosine-5)-methyltransferase 1